MDKTKIKGMDKTKINKTISIIIPNFNGRKLLGENLKVLIQHSSSIINPLEIIVVDDGSSDGSVEFLRENFVEVEVIPLDKNYGFSYACNIGVKKAKADIVYLLNSDIKVCQGFLEPLLLHFQEDDVFAVGSVETKEANKIGMPLAKFKYGIFYYWYEEELGINKEIDTIEVFCVSAGHAAYNREKFLALGGFNKLFRPFYGEDGDICWRAWKKGWRSLYDLRSLVEHNCQSTISKYYTPAQIKAIHWKNRFLFTWKDIISGWHIIKHITFLIPEICIFPLLGRKEFTIGFFKALKQLPEVLQSRREDNIKHPVYSNRQILYRFSAYQADKNNLSNRMEKERETDIRTKPESHNTQFIEAMARYHFIKDLARNKRVLDAGCGFGYGVDYLAQWATEVIGVDFSREALGWAKNNYHRKNIKFILSDITELDFTDDYFDVVCLFEVIHQVKEYQKLLKEMRRLLKKDGFLLVSTRKRSAERLVSPPYHLYEFTAQELEALLWEFGFDRIQIYGVARPAQAYELEKELQSLRNFDFLGLKKLIPRCLVSTLIYLLSKIKRITPPQELKYESFTISRNTVETSPGILAICQKASDKAFA